MNNPTRPKAVQEAMENAGIIARWPIDERDTLDDSLVDLAAYVRELESEREIATRKGNELCVYSGNLLMERDRLKANYESYQKALTFALQILTCEIIPNDAIDAYRNDSMTHNMVNYIRAAYEQIRDSEIVRLQAELAEARKGRG